MNEEELNWDNISDNQYRQMIATGRSAIEYRLLGVVIRPRALTPEDRAELDALYILLAQYDELMNERHWLVRPAEAANDQQADEGK